MDMYHYVVPNKYFHHKKKRIRKKWFKKYGILKGVYEVGYPIGVKSDTDNSTNHNLDITFNATLKPLNEKHLEFVERFKKSPYCSKSEAVERAPGSEEAIHEYLKMWMPPLKSNE